MKCPNCGAASSGNFCSACGASLRRAQCRNCGADVAPGARFCTQCGTATGGAGAGRAATPGGSNLPWYIAGGVLLLMLGILLLPMIRGDTGPASVAPVTAPGTPPPLTGTPRDQADQLFNRIMTARERGDTGEAQRFTPMAIQAYQMASPLDDDGLYHLATVHLVAGDPAAAERTAQQILDRNPSHLLGLGVAAEAATRAGNQARAREYYRKLLAAYDTEMARGLQEYQDHARILPEYRATAEQAGR